MSDAPTTRLHVETKPLGSPASTIEPFDEDIVEDAAPTRPANREFTIPHPVARLR